MRNAYLNFLSQVEASAKKQNLSLTEVARRAGLRDNTLYRLKSSEPKIGRVAAVCEALNLEFYIGPPRGGGPDAPGEIATLLDLPAGASMADAVRTIKTRLKGAGGLDPGALRAEVAAVVKAETDSLRRDMAARLDSTHADLAARLDASISALGRCRRAGASGK